MTRALEGKVAVITGAAGAIGLVTSQLMAERGAAIVAVDRPGTDWAPLKSLLGPDARLATTEADVTDEASVKAYVEIAKAAFGSIDIFFNNAGVEGPIKPIEDYPFDAFMKVLDVNVAGVFLGLKYVLPVMYAQGGGSVINTSSVAGLMGSAGMAGYNTSKHAVVGLTRVAAKEAAPRGVRVNSVNPGPIESRMMQSINSGQSADAKAAHDRTAAVVPAGRYGAPEEVARMVAFLASDEAAYCNGGVYTVDGGLTA